MVAAALGKPGAERFRIGYLAALVHYLVSLYWLLLIPYRWHGIPLGPAAAWLALSGYLALFPAAWVWLVSGGEPEDFGSAPGSDSRCPEVLGVGRFGGTGASGKRLLRRSRVALQSRSWTGRMAWCLLGAASWVAFEMILARLFGGFPWNLLGASQSRLLPLLQVASVTGVYGVSFLVAWFSLALLSAVLMVVGRPTRRYAWVGELCLPMLAVAVGFSLGLREMRRPEPDARKLSVTLVQPSIPQTLIWDESKDEERFRDMVRLSKLALTNRTDLLIWPESAVPRLLRYYPEILDPITRLARDHRVWMIIGADDMEPKPGSVRPEDREFFNASFLISPEGKLVERYKKRNLVIFGEYIPFQRWLPFFRFFTPIEGGFTPGVAAVQFDLADLNARASPLICFEDVFSVLGCEAAANDTDFLVNLTNNGWFGESAAQWQHAVSAIFRAIENGVPLVRCSNNGLTCWVDARGVIRAMLRDSSGTIYGSGFMTFDLPLPPSGQGRERTFYNRHGDWFGWTCVGVTMLAVGLRLLRLRSNSSEGPSQVAKPESGLPR
jgi:apolipoprotein N-acyltransferase